MMDTLSAEFGLAHVVKSPGYTKTKVYDKVVEADGKGLVRKMLNPVSSMFLRPNFPIHFEMFFGNVLCMVRGTISKEMQVTDTDTGYVREHHVWLIFSGRTARHVAIDVNPFVCRDSIWLRPGFTWDHQCVVEARDLKVSEPVSTLMDTLAHVIAGISTEDQLDSLTCEASRLRCLFANAIINGATKIPNIQLPLGRSNMWTRNSIMGCWGQAKLLVAPMSGLMTR